MGEEMEYGVYRLDEEDCEMPPVYGEGVEFSVHPPTPLTVLVRFTITLEEILERAAEPDGTINTGEHQVHFVTRHDPEGDADA